MKKNASCKSIRTNITTSSNGFKPIVKKPLQLDIPTYKNQQTPSNSSTIKNMRCRCLLNHLHRMHCEKRYFQTLKIWETTKT